MKDSKTKKKIFYLLFLTFIIFIFFYFNLAIFNFLSSNVNFAFKPIFSFKNKLSNYWTNDISSNFYFKKNLVKENENLKTLLNELNHKISNYNSALEENLKLKEILGRKYEEDNMILATILSKPKQNFYDTIIIDLGSQDSIDIDQLVFSMGDVPIGKISEVYETSSKAILFSTPEWKMDVIISGHDIFFEMIGRGAGNFEIIAPRELALENGTEVVLPGIKPYVVAKIVAIITDKRDPFQKILLKSPVNINEQKFAQILK